MAADDPLAPYRDRFELPDGLNYLDGNSLGALPTATADRIADVVHREWGERLIRSWNEGWHDVPVRVGDLIGQHVVGAAAGQVAVADSTTVNFYKLVGDFDKRFPEGAPSLREADSFTVEGDWTFGRGVKVVGDVALESTAAKRVEGGTVLDEREQHA